ncbi:MAG TPA: tripartite tricarboxylate transporter substrate-binding protein, partial [Burkholderiales bacterium]
MRQILAALLVAFVTCASGQTFPSRPVTMIVPYAAGGSADVVARPVAAEMGKLLGENVVVELRPGAGGNIGAEYVARSARADGYTILLASLSLATNVSLMKLNFDPRKDLVAIGGITTFPNVLLVSS